MDSGTCRAAERPVQRGKPAGGFVFIRARDLCRLWQTYRQGSIEFRDVRAWFGAQELLARRSQLKEGRLARYGLPELQAVVGGNSPKGCVARLERAGLLAWSEQRLSFPRVTEATEATLPGLLELLQAVTNHRRLVPVPRRTLRLLAQTGKPAVVAAIVGHLLRCVYYRGGEVVSWGTCKASWIGETFGVDCRSVKRARRHLITIGWLVSCDSPRWHRQRWGGSFVVSLAWSRPDSYTVSAGEPESKLPPPPAQIAPVLSPPSVNRDLPSEHKNQKPACSGRSGVLRRKGSRGAPNWKHVEPADLADTRRLLVLFDQAASAGVLGGSDHERLMFVTAAEHATLKGTLNPCGLFVHLVRGKLWHYCTQNDEETARRRINELLFGAVRVREASFAPIPRPRPVVLSEDAKIAAAVRSAANQRRLDAFDVIRRVRPEWTRERWEQAVLEVENARLARIQTAAAGEGFRARPGW